MPLIFLLLYVDTGDGQGLFNLYALVRTLLLTFVSFAGAEDWESQEGECRCRWETKCKWKEERQRQSN